MAPCGCGSRRATVSTDCGLTGTGSAASPLAAAVAAWPYACDLAANAGGVYCDASGQLRGEPLPVTDYFTDGSLESFPAPGQPIPDGVEVIGTYSYTITNPSECRPAYVIIEKEVDVDVTRPPGAYAFYGMVQDFAGGSTDDFVASWNRGSATETAVHVQVSTMGNVVIPPGGTHTEDIVVHAGARGFGTLNATYTRIQNNLRAFILAL